MTKGTSRSILTARAINAMKPGEWLADPAARGAGRLQVRKLANGDAAFYYRYTAPDGSRVRLPLGSGLALVEARRTAEDLSRRYQSGQRDLRGVIEAEQRDAERAHAAAVAAEAARAQQAVATLGALLNAYVAQLKRDGKASAKAVETCITRHVEKPWAALWASPAADVTTDDLLDVVARVANGDGPGDGKLREAAKLRSYLRAAFSAAIRSRQDARSLPALRDLRIRSNPASDLATIEGAQRAKDRALSLVELRAYWKRIEAMDDARGAMLRFHLLTGGQRLEQLKRLTLTEGYDADLKAILMRDAKGRRKTPRLHVVPLVPAAEDAMRAMGGGKLGPFLFTISAGDAGASHSAFLNAFDHVAEAMAKADELEGGAFTPSDLRRTVETRLAATGVSQETRAHLQSHGLGGVQQRHYDRHDYLEEKRDALRTLHRLLVQSSAKVVPLSRATPPKSIKARNT